MITADNDYAVVGARQDVDKSYTLVVFHPDRREHQDWEIVMKPETAIRVSRQLARWAKVAKEMRV